MIPIRSKFDNLVFNRCLYTVAFLVGLYSIFTGNLIAQSSPEGGQLEGIGTESGTPEEITVILPFQEGAQTIQVERVGESLIWQGDILITEDMLAQMGRQGAAIQGADYRWPNAIIPYILRPEHPKRAEIIQAMTLIRDRTNICFKPREEEPDAIYFDSRSRGPVPIGRIGRERRIPRQNGENTVFQGEVQSVGIGPEYTFGNIIHVICHAIGLLHEHTRQDRNQYVQINWSNIEQGKRGRFQTYNSGMDIGTYDYASIMHFPSDAHGIRSCPTCPRAETITPTQSGVSIGQRTQLSSGDIAAINRLYPTPGNCPSGPLQPGGNYPTFVDVPRTERPEGNRQGNDEGNSAASLSGNEIDIWYDVELVPQLTGVSCWAAGAAMVVGWRDWVSIDPEEIADGTGYWGQYHETGLPPNDTTMFNAWGLYTEPPQSYTVEGFAGLLNDYGPLWVASAEPLSGPNAEDAHIRVVVGMIGDGTPEGTMVLINDPWEQGMRSYRPPNRGSAYRETYAEFIRKQHNLAENETNISQAIYLAHP